MYTINIDIQTHAQTLDFNVKINSQEKMNICSKQKEMSCTTSAMHTMSLVVLLIWIWEGT